MIIAPLAFFFAWVAIDLIALALGGLSLAVAPMAPKSPPKPTALPVRILAAIVGVIVWGYVIYLIVQ